MDYIALALAVFKLLNWITGKIDREQLKNDIRRELLAEEAETLRTRMGFAKDVRDKISKMDSQAVDAGLRDLEPKS
jgi:hypothetical protein